jgi:predicted ATPase
MIHLKLIATTPATEKQRGQFPLTVPAIARLERLPLTSPVTFLVGENGSGKSTFLEALACAVGSITVGSESVQTDPTLDAVRTWAQSLKLTWQKRTRRGFFLRAEDFFGYTKRLAAIRQGLADDLAAVDADYEGRSALAIGLAKMPFARELHDMDQRYGSGLDAVSHGESFLQLFQSRFVPGGLYLMDEPEAPLSPLRQLGLLSLLKAMVAQDAQFIIATHSPIIMAFPEATIYNFDVTPVAPVAYDDLEHVTLTRAFLNNPEAYLRHL